MAGLHHVIHGPPASPPGAPSPETVLLLHGLGSSSMDWERQVPALADRFRVIAVDLPGHGQSAAGARRLTVDAMAADVERLLVDRAAPPVHVVGLSLGGCVALALALRAPARVRSLTLLNTFAKLSAAGWRRRGRMVTRLGLLLCAPMSTVAAHVAQGLFPRPEQAALRAAAAERLGRTGRRAYLRSVRALAGFDVRPRLGEIRCPTVVVAGDRDETVAMATKERLRDEIPGARLVVIEDSGHATSYDQPERLNRALLEFLDGVRVTPAAG